MEQLSPGWRHFPYILLRVQREASFMDAIAANGPDLSKLIFQVDAIDASK